MTELEGEDDPVRAGINESVFREINDRIGELNDALDDPAPVTGWVCECADMRCVEKIELSLDEYQDLRSHARRFAVAPSEEHVSTEVEHVVGKTDRYWLVEKVGVAGEIAIETDAERDSTA